jgi:hypothetical protein
MIRKLQIIFTFLWLAGPAMAQAPNFDYPYLIPISGGYIVPSNDFAIPCVGDWDDDGRKALLGRGHRDAGIHQWIWDTTGLPSGIYLAKLATEKKIMIQKLLFLK